MTVIGDPRPAGEEGPAGDPRAAGEEGQAGDPRPGGEAELAKPKAKRTRADEGSSSDDG
jgi:hypothetical protein